jgi:hypothetical protein
MAATLRLEGRLPFVLVAVPGKPPLYSPRHNPLKGLHIICCRFSLASKIISKTTGDLCQERDLLPEVSDTC